MSLSIEEFLKLPDEEKAEKFKLMSNHDKFLWRTQYDIPKAEFTGEYGKVTPEDKEKVRIYLLDFLRKRGVKPPEDLLKPVLQTKPEK